MPACAPGGGRALRPRGPWGPRAWCGAAQRPSRLALLRPHPSAIADTGCPRAAAPTRTEAAARLARPIGAAAAPSASARAAAASPELRRPAGRAAEADGLAAATDGADAAAPAAAEAQHRAGGASAADLAVGGGGGGGGGSGGGGNGDGGASYTVNFGTAVRVLRDDLPQLLARPPQWHIFRPDLVFLSPWAPPLRGLDRYRLLHSVIRILSRLLYRAATVELMRLWIPPSAGPGGEFDYYGSGGSSSRAHDAGDGDGAAPGGAGAGSSAGGGGGGSGSHGGGGGQLRARWRATGQPWLPWADEERIEVVATYKFDSRGLIASHELTTVIPPEPPLLLWPLLAVVQAAGGVRQGASEGVGRGGRVRLPLPGAFDTGEHAQGVEGKR